VIGLSLQDAETRLRSGHLTRDVKTRYSQTVAKGDVIAQTPTAGTRARYGSAVHLVVSAGPQPVKVPAVTGTPVDGATATLRAAGFVVERIDRFSDTVPRGDVIRQHPANGTAPKGSTVTIVVSKGPQSFPMPNVEGMHRTAAEQELASVGLAVHTVVIPSSSGQTVVGQSPAPGTTMHAGDSVTIYVA
jgi:serine/threonine-protein kinase